MNPVWCNTSDRLLACRARFTTWAQAQGGKFLENYYLLVCSRIADNFFHLSVSLVFSFIAFVYFETKLSCSFT